MATLPGDNTFNYVYKVVESGGGYRLASFIAEATTARVTDIAQGNGDDTTLLGDRNNDRFSVSSAGDLNGNYRFVTAAKSSDVFFQDYGFIARQGDDYYFFTDTPVQNIFNSQLQPLAGDVQAICFMPGTAIATPAGTANIEDLSIGDLVTTSDGATKPVRWIGRQTVSKLFADETRLPVRIAACALGDNVPCRDLLVSNDHALLVEGVLVQAGALINGVTITRERDVPAIFTYYHVELDDHSLILAENVPAETFVDNVERYAFDNWAEYQALYPQGRSVPEMDVPRVKAQRQLPSAVRRLVASRMASAARLSASA